MVKNLLAIWIGFGIASSCFAASFQGPENKSQIMLGLSTGLGLVDPKVGIPLVANFSSRLLEHGWLDDVSDQVFLELMLGPTFMSGNTPFQWAAQARWDFIKDSTWTFFGTGGLAGHATGEALGDRFAVFPRFSAGAFKFITPKFALRLDVSHEWILFGVAFGFWK